MKKVIFYIECRSIGQEEVCTSWSMPALISPNTDQILYWKNMIKATKEMSETSPAAQVTSLLTI